jgi:hypothetical protein
LVSFGRVIEYHSCRAVDECFAESVSGFERSTSGNYQYEGGGRAARTPGLVVIDGFGFAENHIQDAPKHDIGRQEDGRESKSECQKPS